MKRLLCALVLGLSGLAVAADLQEAEKLLAAKAYDKAFPLYAKLAESGDVGAQFRLGELYWYGQGTAADLKAATTWLQKAAARGHPAAIESLEIMKQRETRAADIAYWTGGYKGEDLVSGRFNCPAPAIPEVSKTKATIKETSDAYVAWQTCYNGFVANFNDALPIGKRVPADVLRMLTPAEAELVGAHLSRVYDSTITKAQQDATNVTARYAAWQSATERYVKSDNRARNEDYEIAKLRMQERELQNQPQPYTPVVSTPPAGPGDRKSVV